MTDPIRKPLQTVIPHQNVQGWERALSIGTGLVATSMGLSRGGPAGLLRAGLGGLLLLRGFSGHCSLKGLATDPAGEVQYLKKELHRMSDRLAQLSARLAPDAPLPGERVGEVYSADPELIVEPEVAGADLRPKGPH